MFIMVCFVTYLFFPCILCTFFAFEMIKFKSSAYKKTGVKGTESDCGGSGGVSEVTRPLLGCLFQLNSGGKGSCRAQVPGGSHGASGGEGKDPATMAWGVLETQRLESLEPRD